MSSGSKDKEEGVFIPSRWVWAIVIFFITTLVPTISNMFVSQAINPVINKVDGLDKSQAVLKSDMKALDKQSDDNTNRISRIEVAIANSSVKM